MNRYFKLLRRVTPRKVEHMYIKTDGCTTNFLLQKTLIICNGGVTQTTYTKKKRVKPVLLYRLAGVIEVSLHFKKITSHQYEAALKLRQKQVIDCTEDD